MPTYNFVNLTLPLAQSAGPVEYTDCFSAEGGKTPPHEYPE